MTTYITEDGFLEIGSGVPYDTIISSTPETNTVFNTNQLDIDFQVKGVDPDSVLYYDASTGRLGLNTNLPDAMLHVVAPCSKDGLILESITNCPTGVTLLLVHNPQTEPQAGSYPAIITLAGRDTNANEIAYAQIKSRILDPVSESTSGEILFLVDHTGVQKEVFVAGLTNLVLGANNSASGYGYEIVGHNNIGSGNNYLNIGANNSGSILDNSLMIGNNNFYKGPQLFAVVNSSNVDSSGSFAMGLNHTISGNNLVLCGINSVNSGSNNILFVADGYISGSNVLSFSRNSNILGLSGLVLGANIISSGNNNIAIGNQDNIIGSRNSVIGSFVSSSGGNNIIFGNSVEVSGNNLILIGSNQLASGINDGIFIGNNVDLVDTKDVLYIGFNNSTQSGLDRSVIVGANNDLDNGSLSDLIIVGQNNVTNNVSNSIILGNTNNTSGTLKNNIVVGSGNALISNNYNNVYIGALNNQTGIYINSQGEVSGNPRAINSSSINSISIGTHNISSLNNSNLLVGNKNIVSGSNINILGSFNNARNSNQTYVLGNSNYVEGDSIVAVGKNILALGKDIIAVNNKNSPMDIYGSGSLSVGHNSVVCSGTVVGYGNNINGVSGLIYGNNNLLGMAKHLFTFSVINPAQITINALVGGLYKQNDDVLVQVKNPAGTDNLHRTNLISVSEDPFNTTTTLGLGIPINAVNLSNRYYSLNNTFDDNNLANTTGSGIVIALKNYEESKFYGSNTIVIGSTNSARYSDNIVIGNNSNSSGNNTIIIGSNISGVYDNAVHIGTSNINKIIIDNSQVVFNTGTAQQKIIFRGNNGDIFEYHDLVNSRFGINTTQPRSSLDVSGTVTAETLRMGLSTTSGFMLTANADGVGSWTLPVNLSGTNQGLLFKVSDKVASGIDAIRYVNSGTGINFYDNIYILRNSGIIVNADKGTTVLPANVTIWGSGGAFAPKLMEIVPAQNIANFYRWTADSGNITGITIASNVNVPRNLTGTILYVNNSGNLLTQTIYPNNILFSNNNSWSSGNTKFRWMDDQSTLVLGPLTGLISTTISTNPLDTTYNIVLSSDSSLNTSFNNRGLASVFSVYRSGDVGTSTRQGFHVLPTSGQVGINATTGAIIDSQSSLFVNGKISANNFRFTTSPATGLYLKTSSNGDIVAEALTIDSTFSGVYPVRVDVNNVTKLVTARINPLKSNGSSFEISEWGRTLVHDGVSWVVGSGLQLWQDTNGNGIKGLSLGYGTSLSSSSNDGEPDSYNSIAYAGGSFNLGSQLKRGSSQFRQYFLRTRSSDSNQTPYLTMNWQTTDVSSQSRSASNTIKFPLNKEGSWTYQAYVNVLWSDNQGNNKGAGGYILQGTIANLDNTMTHVGTPTVVKNVVSSIPANNISIELNSYAGYNAMDFRASGVVGYVMLWSATVNINQLHWSTSELYTAN
jgi:hypothetical protein